MKLSNSPAAAENALAWTNEAGFEALVNTHFAVCYAIALARLRDAGAAEDLTQEVFLRAFLQYDIQRGAAAFGPWVVCVTRNLAVDWSRRQQTVSKVLSLVTADAAQEVRTMTDTRPSAREQMMREQESATVDAALNRLDDEKREIVLLHFMENLSKREIAERLSVHPSTVGRHLDKALEEMRASLEPTLRETLTKRKAGAAVTAKTLAIVGAASGMPASAKAAVIANASFQQGASAITAANAISGSLTTAASLGVKGAVIVGSGKLVAAVVGVGVAAAIGFVVINKKVEFVSGAPLPPATAPIPVANGKVLVPPGWKLDVNPTASLGMSMSSSASSRTITGVNVDNALSVWGSSVMDVADPVKNNKERYDVKLTAPPGTPDTEINRVLQAQYQESFKMRVTTEQRSQPCIVISAPHGVPSAFMPTSAPNPSTSMDANGAEMKKFTMDSFADNVSWNRKMKVFNQTGISGEFDAKLPKGFMSDEGLRQLGFDVKIENRNIDVTVVRPM